MTFGIPRWYALNTPSTISLPSSLQLSTNNMGNAAKIPTNQPSRSVQFVNGEIENGMYFQKQISNNFKSNNLNELNEDYRQQKKHECTMLNTQYDYNPGRNIISHV